MLCEEVMFPSIICFGAETVEFFSKQKKIVFDIVCGSERHDDDDDERT